MRFSTSLRVAEKEKDGFAASTSPLFSWSGEVSCRIGRCPRPSEFEDDAAAAAAAAAAPDDEEDDEDMAGSTGGEGMPTSSQSVLLPSLAVSLASPPPSAPPPLGKDGSEYGTEGA